MNISAWACSRARGPFAPFEYEPAPLGAHDCEIRITHCGICHSDLHLANGEWGAVRYPLVPGHEIVGTVVAAGTAMEALMGRRVGVGWQRSACLECGTCRGGDENLCGTSQATCVGHHGGFADRIRVDGRFAFEIPAALDAAATAPLLCGGITVYSPLRRFGVGPSTRVAVVGIGGLGHLALRFARALGAGVTAFSSSPAKEAEALRLGADDFVDSSVPQALQRQSGRFDLVLSTASATLPWADYLDLLRPHGQLCLVGVPDQPLSIPPFSLIKGERNVGGSAIGSRQRIREMLDFAAEHSIGAQVEVLPMTDVNSAMQRLAANEARYRIVLEA